MQRVKMSSTPSSKANILATRFARHKKRPMIYIIPTWYCFLLNFLLLALLAYGFLNQSIIIFASTLSVFFLELLSMIEANINLQDLRLDSIEGAAVEAGSTACLNLRVASASKSFGIQMYAAGIDEPPVKSGGIPARLKAYNRRRKSASRNLIRHEIGSAMLNWDKHAAVRPTTERSFAEDSAVVSVDYLVGPRGVFKFPKIVCVSMFPFGLFRVIREYAPEGTFVSYPRPSGASYRDRSVQQQNIESAKQGSSVATLFGEEEYAEHKVFTAGDNLRRMDWKASSRRGVKIVKIFSGTSHSDRRVLKWSDTSPSPPELRLEQMSLWVQEAFAAHIPFSIELPGSSSMMALGERHKLHCLTLLAAFKIPVAGDEVAR
jgi:Protein of unknown function DUF58